MLLARTRRSGQPRPALPQERAFAVKTPAVSAGCLQYKHSQSSQRRRGRGAVGAEAGEHGATRFNIRLLWLFTNKFLTSESCSCFFGITSLYCIIQRTKTLHPFVETAAEIKSRLRHTSYLSLTASSSDVAFNGR